MNKLSIEEKREQILTYEESRAHQLARRVIDKPVPALWMILIPVLFVFHAWKIKEYSSGLKDFAEHYLVSRRRALETACEAAVSGKKPDTKRLLDDLATIPEKARPSYQEWTSLLIDHYLNLLMAQGSTIEALIRSHYRNKANYLLFISQLSKTEKAFNVALLPKIEGDQQDLRYVLDKMEKGITELRRKEVEKVFG